MNTKLSVSLIALMLVSVGFGMISSDSAQAAFVQDLAPSPNLPANFIAYDTAWNEAGTMAVVVGVDQDAAPPTNAYAYYPANNSYWPIDNAGWNQQNLHAVDYFSEPVYDWPNVLLVDADWSEENLISFYQGAFNGVNAYVDTWDVWNGIGQGEIENQGKPTAEDMAPYDLVVWIPSRWMVGYESGGDALNLMDSYAIQDYLDGGGNFFIANMALSSYFPFGSVGQFTYDYLGASSWYTTSYEYYARPFPSDSVFGSLPTEWMSWYSYGWSGYPSSVNVLTPSLGSTCFQTSDSGPSFWDNTGLRYDSGTFKTVYLGFPLETMSVNYASSLMENMLEWISSAPLDQANEAITYPVYLDAGMATGNPWAQSFIPMQTTISKVEFYMYSESPVSDYFRIEIHGDAGGMPSTGNYTYGFIMPGAIPVGMVSAGWVPCSFVSSPTLSTGDTYWIVCTRIGTTAGQYWLSDLDCSYPFGYAAEYSGGWGLPESYDWVFRTYAGTAGGTPQTIVLTPVKDNTIYSEYTSNSNGMGQYLISGTDWFPHQRRAMLEFDIAGIIPKYSTITSVSLSMYCSNFYNSNGYDVELLPLMDEWGEAGSDAQDMEETGTSAMTGDVTWDYAYYMSEPWMPGGDWGSSSGSTSVSNMGYYTWGTTSMVVNVQAWLDNPGTNHGWMLRNELTTETAKWFNSRNHPSSTTWPMLSITYSEPTIIGYRDVFWIAGDTQGPTPPATAYRLVPSKGLNLIPMNDASTGQYFGVAVDDIGNPLFTGQGNQYMYYYDGTGWMYIDADFGSLASYWFYGIDFNPNDRRFYATGPDFTFYTDPVPLTGSSDCHQFNHFPQYGGVFFSDLAWNELYDYGLVGGNGYMLKIWPYDEYGNGTIRYKVENINFNEVYRDISWDSDGWNEAGIVGTYSTSKMYWRYYNSNPQLIEGYNGLAGTYYTCAFKPPSSPKWLFIPHAMGSIRVNVEEKDESTELIVSANFPHIFNMGMWKQNDAGHIPMFGTQVEADSTYTIFLECNYTLGGVDQWDTSLGLYLQGWFDFGNVGGASVPGDATWSMNMYRVRQFNISYSPATASATMNYPAQIGPVAEFAIHSVWEDPINYGADLSHYRIYINVTFGSQTEMAPGDGMWNSGNSWDRNSLNDPHTWDFKAFAYDTVLPESHNCSYAEFGVQRYAALTVSGNPSGSIPPGSSAILAAPTLVTYSSNMPYQLNVSLPNLYLNGDTGSPYFIPANFVSVMNEQGDDDAFNSDIWDWRTFTAPNDAWCIWGLESGTYMSMPGHGTVTAGPYYTDYSAALLAMPFEPTPIRWQVAVPAGTAEGVYRGTITITLWSY